MRRLLALLTSSLALAACSSPTAPAARRTDRVSPELAGSLQATASNSSTSGGCPVRICN